MTARSGEAGEGRAAVGGNRSAGKVAAGSASRIVVGDDDLKRVIRIGRRESLRLDNMRRVFGASNQVNVRGAKERCQELLDKRGGFGRIGN